MIDLPGIIKSRQEDVCVLVPHTGEFIFNPGRCCQLESSNTNVLCVGSALGPIRAVVQKASSSQEGSVDRKAGTEAVPGNNKGQLLYKGWK